jgi:hypothetical protein
MINAEMEAMAIAMPEVKGHPNRVAFQGVLTVVDMPSHKAPSGSRGHLVVLSRKAAEEALPSLLGMALDYSPSFDRHDVRRKVGVITQADLVGRSLEVSGHLFARDFPEIVEEIGKEGKGASARAVQAATSLNRFSCRGIASSNKTWKSEFVWKHSVAGVAGEARAFAATIRKLCIGGKSTFGEIEATNRAEDDQLLCGSELGMSYEVAEVEVADRSATIWVLKKVVFTGAAILRRNKAAYQDTWIELE